mmetsp:Transcript_15722/g.37977  ORF Transcript_15722/g.37977 Transcript_15722/m.37977 type:complete len:306 (-) Transcript_15722:12-929(-)
MLRAVSFPRVSWRLLRGSRSRPHLRRTPIGGVGNAGRLSRRRRRAIGTRRTQGTPMGRVRSQRMTRRKGTIGNVENARRLSRRRRGGPSTRARQDTPTTFAPAAERSRRSDPSSSMSGITGYDDKALRRARIRRAARQHGFFSKASSPPSTRSSSAWPRSYSSDFTRGVLKSAGLRSLAASSQPSRLPLQVILVKASSHPSRRSSTAWPRSNFKTLRSLSLPPRLLAASSRPPQLHLQGLIFTASSSRRHLHGVTAPLQGAGPPRHDPVPTSTHSAAPLRPRLPLAERLRAPSLRLSLSTGVPRS